MGPPPNFLSLRGLAEVGVEATSPRLTISEQANESIDDDPVATAVAPCVHRSRALSLALRGRLGVSRLEFYEAVLGLNGMGLLDTDLEMGSTWVGAIE